MRRAWESPARAELLREVGPLIHAAAEGDPRDPVPWRIALDHARGAHAGHTVFESLWEQAVRRSPHHYGCHVAALQYLSAAWYGSHRECFDFAERAAAGRAAGLARPGAAGARGLRLADRAAAARTVRAASGSTRRRTAPSRCPRAYPAGRPVAGRGPQPAGVRPGPAGPLGRTRWTQCA